METIENLLFKVDIDKGTIYYTPKWDLQVWKEKPSQYEFRDTINSICQDFYERTTAKDLKGIIITNSSLMSKLVFVMLHYIEGNAIEDALVGKIKRDYGEKISKIETTYLGNPTSYNDIAA
ncbi:MAG: hypothetical protein BJBARM5_0235 [Candidatus Parvarchaeum acidophilus ARMAN-5]|jgi:hypothetical protein|uniref:Uncharacterized protein n=1 Tax=Candidatus Parvarchaeum acidophilus ARMAN-5 TaxID=662762 RepID=D6GUT8_PARA5|nr:MAG: hypothetical protein BJBARM5_0235 [Candidatus Parvarchaeum acidophilus ARMAN-5]